MGDVVSAVVKDLSCCRDCARFVCNDAAWHSRCCDSEDVCCECDAETRPVKPPEEDLDIDIEVDNPGCCDVKGLCCFLHPKKK